MKVGAIWIKKDKNGNNYYSIALEIKGEEYNFKVFKNTKKTEAKQPDFSILDGQQNQQPKQQQNNNRLSTVPAASTIQSGQPQAQPAQQVEDINIVDIPF